MLQQPQLLRDRRATSKVEDPCTCVAHVVMSPHLLAACVVSTPDMTQLLRGIHTAPKQSWLFAGVGLTDGRIMDLGLHIVTDACVKINRIEKCGKHLKDLEPSRTTYYGAADSIVQAEFAAGQPEKPAVLTAAATAEHGADVCEAHLHCARAHTQRAGILDREGIIVFFCRHGVPGHGTLVDMPTAEQFRYVSRMQTCYLLHLPCDHASVALLAVSTAWCRAAPYLGPRDSMCMLAGGTLSRCARYSTRCFHRCCTWTSAASSGLISLVTSSRTSTSRSAAWTGCMLRATTSSARKNPARCTRRDILNQLICPH